MVRLKGAGQRGQVSNKIDISTRIKLTANKSFFRSHNKVRPKLMIDIEIQFRKFEFKPKGVIHIGAHEANELETYKALGFQKILYIEANSQLAFKLKAKFQGQPNIMVAHAAITDHNGTVNLKITSFDQSSSILSLAMHKEIYPAIQQIGEETVLARTLDLLLFELDLDPSEFNFLVLDIQGAELLALKGAIATLRHIDAVQTEISFAELYEGCALLPDIDNFMTLQGFGRSEVVTQHHPTWGDAFYVRRPVISMTSLGSNGRLGNQLFQYLYLWSVAEAQNALIHTPHWIGKDLFGLRDTTPCAIFPSVKELTPGEDTEDNSNIKIHGEILLKKLPSFTSMDLWGYFQLHTSNYVARKESIQSLFTPAPEYRPVLDGILEKLRSDNKKVIAVHLRRGDYGHSNFYRAPCSWYEKWIEEEGLSPVDFRIYICSEEPKAYHSRFKDFDVMSYDSLGLDPSLSVVVDTYIMARADILAISNSSLSFFAAMLNSKANRFVRPDINSERLVSFDPWSSDVLQCQNLSDLEHKRLWELD
jgi:FkbM family methyltransferase